MSLAGEWQRLQGTLPDHWERAELRLETGDPATAERASALLAPAQPFRATPTALRFAAAVDGTASGPDAITRLLRRLDEARVIGVLELFGSHVAPEQQREATTSLVDGWQAALAGVPPDWSDLYAELDLLSSDYVDPGAVLCAPLNPRRDGTRTAFRFRSARRAGYGASPAMVHRCLTRCDDEGIRGSVEILHVLSDTQLVATQGPTWLVPGGNV